MIACIPLCLMPSQQKNIIDEFQEFLLMAENIPMSASYLIIQMDMVAWCGQLLDHARWGRHFRSV
jgi:hypothetical protein